MPQVRLVAKAAWSVWKRLPPKQKKQVLDLARKHGPDLVRKHGPKVAKHIVKARAGKRK